jgi:hypothetical protein
MYIVVSIYIMQSTLRSPEKHQKAVYQVMVSLSAWAILFSFFSNFLSTWPILEGAVYESVGGRAKHPAQPQGFLVQFIGTFSTSNNAALGFIYLFIVRYSWTEERIGKIEPILFFLVPIICIVVIVAIPPFKYDIYNFHAWNCYIEASPLGCNLEDSTTPCEQGANARVLSLWFSFLPIFLYNIIIIIGSMLLFYQMVFQKE